MNGCMGIGIDAGGVPRRTVLALATATVFRTLVEDVFFALVYSRNVNRLRRCEAFFHVPCPFAGFNDSLPDVPIGG